MAVRMGMGSYRADNWSCVAVRMGMDCDILVNRAVLTGDLLVDRLADLSGNWMAFFYWGGNWDLDWDCTALSDGLSHTFGFWDLSDNSGALGHRFGVTDG